MSSQKEKEIRRLIYLKNELIKQQKKELKQLRFELEKELEKQHQKVKKR